MYLDSSEWSTEEYLENLGSTMEKFKEKKEKKKRTCSF